jgi:hypothetical protein
MIFLGSVTVPDGETAAFSFPPDASPDAIREALIAAEEERVAAQARETKKLREMFLKREATDG